MITAPDETTASPRYRLRTLGALRLIGLADETVLGDHGHQRRRLALLAVLAASGDAGRSRDQLLGLFWPDVSQERARHSLGQLVYAIRTSVGGSVFTGMNPLRLNHDFIDSDIAAFSDALDSGNIEAAVEQYGGPFLDGFYLDDALEFEQWMESERARIAQKYTDALEQLAKRAEDAGDAVAAVRWRQKLVDTDPVSSRHATGLIRALMNAGDHSAALQYAERYEKTVAQELGTSVGPAVATLVNEVRERAKTGSVVIRGGPASVRKEPDTASSVSIEYSEAMVPGNDAPPQLSVRRKPKTLLYGLGAIGLAALLFSAWLLRPEPGSTSPSAADVSLAVLPFANVSGDSRDAPIVDGLSEELIGALGKIQRLNVTARSSAFVFRNSNLDVRQIGDSLGVSHVVEGSVQKIAQRLRVQVRLIDARDGSTRWSETYDRDVQDIFLVQSEIATAVARELELRLGEGARNALRRIPTKNIAAYELYLRGNDPANLRSDSGVRAAQQYFRDAIALDSTFAGAYAGLARTYQRSISTAPRGTSPRDLHVLARQTALRAIALDDSLPEAHASLGAIAMAGYDFITAERELKRATAMEPGNSRTREWLTRLHHWKEQPLDALAEANRAVANDPLSPSARAEAGRTLCATGRHAEGLAELKRLETVRPPLLRVAGAIWLCHALKGDWKAAIAHPSREGEARRGAYHSYALARAGRQKEARSILADLTERSKRTGYDSFSVAIAHAGLGDRDEAFDWLNRSIDDFSLSWEIMLPLFRDLHADARFTQFRSRLGLQKR